MRRPGGFSDDLLQDGDMLVGIDGVERSEFPGLETNEMPGHSSLYSSVWLRTFPLNSGSGGNATPSTPLCALRDPEFMPLEHVAERYDAYFGTIEVPRPPTSRADPEYMWHYTQSVEDLVTFIEQLCGGGMGSLI